MTTFDEARKELRAAGVLLSAPPGQYTVSKVGMPDTAFSTDDLAEAIARGRAIAALNEALRQLPPIGPMKFAHNRKVAARRRKESRDG